MRVRGAGVGESLVMRRRDAVALHESLGEILRRLELGGFLRRSEDPQVRVAERIDHARGERPLGAYDGRVDAFVLGEPDELRDQVDVDVEESVLTRGSGVAGSDVDTRNPGRLRQPPGDGMLAPAGADHQEFQCRKCRMPVNTIAMPCSSAAAITSLSRTLPPGWITALAPAWATTSKPSRKGKKASEATTEPRSDKPAVFALIAAMRVESTRL